MTILTQAAQAQTQQLSADARSVLASHVSDDNDFRNLATMLGIVEESDTGSLTPSCPWDEYDPRAGKTKVLYHTMPW